MPDSDWTDPFADDPAAAERERRRAEREARRRQRQQSLGAKVKQGGGEPEPAPPAADDALTATPRAAGRDAAEPPEPATAPLARPSQPASRAPRVAAGDRGMPSRTLIARRLMAATVLIAAAVGLVLGISALLDRLGGTETKPQPVAEVKTRELTIPEGLDRRQIAELTREKNLKGDYAEASKNFKGFKLGKYGAGGAPSLEGFLFPATYELPRKATAKDLIERQLAAFEDNVAGVDMGYAKQHNLNTYDVLKIASMIEREIQVPEERRLAAAVIYNRLKAGTPLGIDATIRYEDQNYDEQILASRLDQATPYNTRIVTGLPPTPIGNPGLASIEAAAKPAKSDAFFFVVKPGTCGEHVFLQTQEEFDQAEAEYQQALQEQGGSPTEC